MKNAIPAKRRATSACFPEQVPRRGTARYLLAVQFHQFERRRRSGGLSLVSHSVLNYGLPDISGRVVSNIDPLVIERILRQALWDYEPRILRNSVRIRHAPIPEARATTR